VSGSVGVIRFKGAGIGPDRRMQRVTRRARRHHPLPVNRLEWTPHDGKLESARGVVPGATTPRFGLGFAGVPRTVLGLTLVMERVQFAGTGPRRCACPSPAGSHTFSQRQARVGASARPAGSRCLSLVTFTLSLCSLRLLRVSAVPPHLPCR
jgi:hypothetical protein